MDLSFVKKYIAPILQYIIPTDVIRYIISKYLNTKYNFSFH